MKENGGSIAEIQLDKLLTTVMDRKNNGYRLAQICCVFVNEKYELSYSFAKEYELLTYRIIIDRDTQVPSITNIYDCSFLYENEMKELFGVRMEYISIDYKNKLYRIEEETPFMEKEGK